MRTKTWLTLLCGLALALGPAACGDDDGGGNPDAAVNPDGTTGPDSTTGSDGGPGPDAGPQTEQFLELQLSATVITEADEAGSVTATCLAFDTAVSEAPLDPDPGDPLTVEVSGLAVQSNGDDHTFEDHGVATVTCSKAGWSASTTGEVTVIGEWIDPRYATVSSDMGRVQAGLRSIRNAQNGADALAIAAYADLQVARADLDTRPLPADAPVFLDFPGGLPDRATIEAALPPTADDAPFMDGIARLRQLLQTSTARLVGLDAANLSQADVDDIAADAQALQTELDTLAGLAPGPGAVIDARIQLAELLLDDLPANAAAVSGYAAAVAAHQEPTITSSPKFGFISLAMGCFNTSNLQVTLINKVYGKYLGELDAAFNTLIVGAIVDSIWPPTAGGPEITFVQASASVSFACPGYNSLIMGYNFNPTAYKNVFIIIGANLTAAAEAAWNAINVGEDDTIFDVIEKLQAFQEAVDGLGANVIIGTDVIPDYLGPGEDAVDIGPWPDTNPGTLPSPVHIIPINHDVGRGQSYQLNELGSC